MINKIKYLFLLILCVGVIGGAARVSAQYSNDQTLVAGKNSLRQSDIDSLIKFYEWAFEAKFTAAQRAKFQQYTESEFRRNPASSRKTIDDIVNTMPQILAADENTQQKVRETFLAEFMPEARRDSDASSQMLVGIYDAAHGGSQTNDAEENNVNSSYQTKNSSVSNDADDSARNVGNIAALAGKWVWGRTGSGYVNSTTGVYAGGNGSRHTYQFYANGTVEYTGIMNVMTGGCNMQIFKTSKGRASLNGNTLTINWSPASFSRDDSCSPAKNYKKTLPAETETYKVAFKDSYGQKQLCMSSKDETCFSPAK